MNRHKNALAAVTLAAGILPEGSALVHDAVAFANESRFNEAYFNEPLTQYAVGWRDRSPIEQTLEFVAPRVLVPRRFNYAEATNAEAFLGEIDDSDIREIGGDFKKVLQYTSTKTDASTQNKGLTIRVDLDQVAETVNWEQRYTEKLMRRLLRSELYRAITLLSAGATNTAKTWDTSSGKDPDQDVLTDLNTGADSSGIRANRVYFGETAWTKRRLAHRAQDTAGGYASAGMSEAEVAAFIGVDRVYVGRERYQSTASAKSLFGGALVLEFQAADGMDTEDPSNIKRFVSPAGPGDFRVYSQQITAKIHEITVEHYSLIKVTSTLGLRKLTIS